MKNKHFKRTDAFTFLKGGLRTISLNGHGERVYRIPTMGNKLITHSDLLVKLNQCAEEIAVQTKHRQIASALYYCPYIPKEIQDEEQTI